MTTRRWYSPIRRYIFIASFILFRLCLVKSFDDEYESDCTHKCGNHGQCIGIDVCDCDTGFESTDDGDCDAICTITCQNSICRKGKCECFEGYTYQKSDPSKCIPFCKNGCHSGKCVAPDICLCEEGNYFDYLSKLCEPICIPPCRNSRCISSNECQCHAGYVKDYLLNGSCSPICSPECVNAVCSEPNNCQCSKGYKPMEGKPNECTNLVPTTDLIPTDFFNESSVTSEAFADDIYLTETTEKWQPNYDDNFPQYVFTEHLEPTNDATENDPEEFRSKITRTDLRYILIHILSGSVIVTILSVLSIYVIRRRRRKPIYQQVLFKNTRILEEG